MRHATNQMPEWDAQRIVDEDLARRLITDQCFAPRTLELLGEGWDNTVWLADERYAFRFPRREVALAGVAREILVLPKLTLPAAVPVPVFVGEPTDPFPWPWFGAERIVGAEPLELGVAARNALGRPLGEFLRALHDSVVDVELPVDPMGRADPELRVERTRAVTEVLGWELPDGLIEGADGDPAAPVLLHGDLHVRHLLVRDGTLAGVIDWGDVCLGDPCIDLSLVWSLLPPDGAADFFAAYGRVSESQMRRARVLALSLCAALALYARHEGHPELFRESRKGYVRASRAL
jgi:aminoglycoside phosphotransferase (APT) family kinase protein